MSVGMGDDLLGPLMEWPDVLREHVLKKLNPTDLSLLSLTNKRVRAAVEESGSPIAGDEHRLQLVMFMGSHNMARWALCQFPTSAHPTDPSETPRIRFIYLHIPHINTCDTTTHHRCAPHSPRGNRLYSNNSSGFGFF